MNKADIIGIILIVCFTGIGAFLGFTRGLAGFLGIFFAAQFAFQGVAEPVVEGSANKCLWTFIGISVGLLVVGFLFYGATHFTPMEAMDQVFGAIFGFLMGWGVAYFTFHYYLIFQNSSEFAVLIWDGRTARAIHDIAPYAQFMGKMDRFRNPHLMI